MPGLPGYFCFSKVLYCSQDLSLGADDPYHLIGVHIFTGSTELSRRTAELQPVMVFRILNGL